MHREVPFIQTNDQVISSFQSYLQNWGKESGTIQGITVEIQSLAEFLQNRNRLLSQLQQEDRELFGKHLLESGKSMETIYSRLRNLMVFLRFLTANGWAEEDAESWITNSSAYLQSMPRPLTAEEVRKVILFCPDLKQRVLFTFLYETGIRPIEAARIKQEDVNWDDLYVLVRGNREEKPRPIFFNRKLKDVIRKYLRTRKDRLPYLFVDGNALFTRARMQVLFRSLRGSSQRNRAVVRFRTGYQVNVRMFVYRCL
ncbi:tyrosine-type recombinase/integrase [Effusibacillus dendaii]|uniref:tyrosine-type recombinase/integrase n=1 Tax=Effusibacillus dendaii TaxID=2743772 RepID=UPI001909F075|nr:tyrosine-type recombinase/integrase [Effusibacillus dendaii]